MVLVSGDAKTGEQNGDTIELDLGASREGKYLFLFFFFFFYFIQFYKLKLIYSLLGSRTDTETLQREEEAINIDGLNVAQVKQLRDKVK